MNELEKRAQAHNKKKDGLSPFCSLGEAGYKSGDRYYGGLPADPDYRPEKEPLYWKEVTQYFVDTVPEYPEYSILGKSPFSILLRTPDGKEKIDLRKFDVFSDAAEAVEMASNYFDPELFEAKKKKKPFDSINTNAGNVEHNIAMFNKMNSPTEGPCTNPVSGPMGGDVCAESLDEARDPYFTPYGYKDAAKVLNGKAPEYYYHLKEIEMDQGDGEKLARYARKIGLPVVQDPDDDPDYPTFYILGKYHWNDYFYPYPSNWEPSIENVVEENMNYNIQFYQIFRSPTSPTENGKMVAQASTEEEAHQKGVHLCGKGNYLIKAVCDDGKVRYLECFTESLAPKKETVELEYKDLEFTQYGTKRDVDDWDEWDRCMDWTYEVDKDDLYTFIFESCIDETDFPEAFEDEFDPNNPEHWARFESWLDDNFDAIYSKYEEKILENWEEDAAEEASDEYDPDDYVDWDSMPGGHDDDRYWEDLNEGETVFMESYTMGKSHSNVRELRMIDYFEQMNNSEEDEA